MELLSEQLRRDQLLLQEQLSEQNRDLREAHIKSLYEMEDLKRVQELRIDEFSTRRLTENQDTMKELTARNQELQNEVNCMNDPREEKMLSQYAVDYPTFPVNQRYSNQPYRDPKGMRSRKDKPPDILDTPEKSGNVFENPPASSSSLYPGAFNPWIPNVTEHISPHVISELQNPDTPLGRP